MIFGLFKQKKLNKYATTLYEVLAPQINLAKEFGKWPDFTTMCDYMIDNDYLLSYLNMYLNISTKIQFKLTNSADSGMIITKVLQMIEPTFADNLKLMRYMDRLQISTNNPKFKKGADDAFMTCVVMFDMQEQDQFKNNKAYKEAFDYFDNGKFNDDKRIVQELGIKNSSQFGNIPKRFIIAHRIYEMTFGKELASHFKFKNPII